MKDFSCDYTPALPGQTWPGAGAGKREKNMVTQFCKIYNTTFLVLHNSKPADSPAFSRICGQN
jgi:hypothetical protein